MFEAFRTSDDLCVIFRCFIHLYRRALLAPSLARHGEEDTAASQSLLAPPWAAPSARRQPWRFPYEPIRVLIGGHWKAKQLWAKLDDRCRRPEYCDMPLSTRGGLGGVSSRGFASQPMRAVVIGAGPSGLRSAIELRLLGASVVVVERRERFSRLNRLHLWRWCGEELKALGARCLEPPPTDFGADPDLLHIGIGELQTLLLKTALLLGVQVLLGTEYLGVDWVAGGQGAGEAESGWAVHLRQHHAGAASSTGEDGEVASIGGVNVLIGASGQSCDLSSLGAGLESVEVGSLRSEEAIGLVFNIRPGVGAAERSLRSFALARQFYERLFQRLRAETGADLENVVYTRSKASHYFVMTPTRRCLVECGVFRDAAARPVLSAGNVDHAALDRLVRRVVAFRFKEEQPPLAEAFSAVSGDITYADGGPQLFDFSRMKRAVEGLAFVSPPPDERGAAPLMAALAGDALVEPFWPEGLGIIRGFFGAMDVAWAARSWALGDSPEQVRADFGAAYGQLKSLAAQSRRRVLLDDEANYSLAPSSRYCAL